MRKNLFIRLVAVGVAVSLITASAQSTEYLAPSHYLLVTHNSVLGADFGSQALATPFLSGLHGAHQFLSRLVGIRTASALLTLSIIFPSVTWAQKLHTAGTLKLPTPFVQLDVASTLATIIFIGFLRWWLNNYPHVSRKWIKLAAASTLLVSFYFYSTYQVYLFSQRTHDVSGLSYLAISTLCALVAWTLTQFIRQATGKPDPEKWKSLLFLLALNDLYSAIVEEWGFDVALPQIPGIHGLLAPETTQALSDSLGYSPYFFEPAAFYAYSRGLLRKSPSEAVHEIREYLVGFYAAYGWVWFIFIFLAMKTANPLLGFRLVNMGILFWNVAFETEKWPTSQQVLERVRRHWWLFPVRLLLEPMQAFLNRIWIGRFLYRGIVLHYLAAFVHRIIPMPSAVMEFVTAVGLWGLWRMLWPRRVALGQSLIKGFSLNRILKAAMLWFWLFGIASAAGETLTQNAGAAQSPGSHQWVSLLAAGTLTMLAAVVAISKQQESWVMEFSRRLQAVAHDWHKKELLTHPVVFGSTLHDIAVKVSEKIQTGNNAKAEWTTHRESMTLLLRLLEGLIDPAHAQDIQRLASPSRKKKDKDDDQKYKRRWLLRMNSEFGSIFVHVMTRTDPEKLRVKFSFWRDGPPIKREAAMDQFRFDLHGEPHIDAVRAHKPHPTDKGWVQHDSLRAGMGLEWVHYVSRQIDRFPRGFLTKEPRPVLRWMRFSKWLTKAA